MSHDEDEQDDFNLFRESVAGTRPLKVQQRALHDKPKAPPIPRQRIRDENEVLSELLEPADPAEELDLVTGEELLHIRDGYPPRMLKRLRRGHYVTRDVLDLHHMNHDTARDCLLAFIDESIDAGAGCVRVIHGKGLRSRRGPVLKQMVHRVLRRHPAVIAFASCRPVDGGTGAVSILLRDKRRLRR